jgi:hypothetical protein
MQNSAPAFTKSGVIGAARPTAANVKSDGAGTIGSDMFLILTADATNGTYIDYVRVLPVSSAAATSTTLSVIRIYASSIAAGATTNADTFLVAEVALPIQSAANSTLPVTPVDIPCNFRLPAGWTLLCSTHIVAVTNTANMCVAFGGNY